MTNSVHEVANRVFLIIRDQVTSEVEEKLRPNILFSTCTSSWDLETMVSLAPQYDTTPARFEKAMEYLREQVSKFKYNKDDLFSIDSIILPDKFKLVMDGNDQDEVEQQQEDSGDLEQAPVKKDKDFVKKLRELLEQYDHEE